MLFDQSDNLPVVSKDVVIILVQIDSLRARERNSTSQTARFISFEDSDFVSSFKEFVGDRETRNSCSNNTYSHST